MITKGIKRLCSDAEVEIETIEASEAISLFKNNTSVIN